MKIELSGLVIGPEDLLVVKMPKGADYKETHWTADQLREIMGERFVLFKGDVELAAIRKADVDKLNSKKAKTVSVRDTQDWT